MVRLTSQQALALAADFALSAEQMRRGTTANFQHKADFYETACRVAFLRAGIIAKDEETRPAFGQLLRRAAFAIA